MTMPKEEISICDRLFIGILNKINNTTCQRPTFKIVDLLSFPRGNLFALYPKVKISQLKHIKNIEFGYITILE